MRMITHGGFLGRRKGEVRVRGLGSFGVILIMPCRSEETLDEELKITWMGLNPPLNSESRKKRKATALVRVKPRYNTAGQHSPSHIRAGNYLIFSSICIRATAF